MFLKLLLIGVVLTIAFLVSHRIWRSKLTVAVVCDWVTGTFAPDFPKQIDAPSLSLTTLGDLAISGKITAQEMRNLRAHSLKVTNPNQVAIEDLAFVIQFPEPVYEIKISPASLVASASPRWNELRIQVDDRTLDSQEFESWPVLQAMHVWTVSVEKLPPGQTATIEILSRISNENDFDGGWIREFEPHFSYGALWWIQMSYTDTTATRIRQRRDILFDRLGRKITTLLDSRSREERPSVMIEQSQGFRIPGLIDHLGSIVVSAINPVTKLNDAQAIDLAHNVSGAPIHFGVEFTKEGKRVFKVQKVSDK